MAELCWVLCLRTPQDPPSGCLTGQVAAVAMLTGADKTCLCSQHQCKGKCQSFGVPATPLWLLFTPVAVETVLQRPVLFCLEFQGLSSASSWAGAANDGWFWGVSLPLQLLALWCALQQLLTSVVCAGQQHGSKACIDGPSLQWCKLLVVFVQVEQDTFACLYHTVLCWTSG